MKFNVNDYVWVKLTDHGRKIHREQYDFLFRDTGLKYLYQPPEEDEDGWSKWQIWCLMKDFGVHMGMGLEPPFETVVKIDELSCK